ncbi:alpha/beta hydrolase family esterase [Paracidovorax citrulli]
MKFNLFRWVRAAASLSLVAALAACGGDDDNKPAPAPVEPPPAIQGLASGTVTVNGVAREYHYYLPSNLEALKARNLKNIRIVMSFHDQGESVLQNAHKTRWHELGEEKGFVVIYPSAVNGNWNTAAAASGPDELAYVHAAWSDIRARFNISDTNAIYPTGFGKGASMANQLAMMGPVIGYLAPISAVAAIDGVAEPAIFALPKTEYRFPATPGAVQRSEATPYGRSLPPTAMSVWQITTKPGTALNQQVDYWKQMNKVDAAAVPAGDASFDTTVHRNADNPFQEVRVSTAKEPALSGKALSEYLWTNMFSKVIRFKNDDRVNGTLVAFKTEEELGLKEVTRGFSEAAGGERRYLTYLPSNYEALAASGNGLPLVFNFHGIRGSAWWQAINTDFIAAAEKNGFIAVFPQGLNAVFSSELTENTAKVNYDVQYILELIDQLKSEYKIDTTRIFASGVSAGAMFTNRLIVEYPQVFAGAAPCYSGSFSAAVYNNYRNYPQIRTDVPIPVWQCRGGTEADNTFPNGAAGQEAARRFWRVVVNGHAEAATEEEAVPTRTATYGPEDRRHVKYFTGAKADYAWQVTDYVPHFWHPGGQAELMWTEMFAKYRRNADGTLSTQP